MTSEERLRAMEVKLSRWIYRTIAWQIIQWLLWLVAMAVVWQELQKWAK